MNKKISDNESLMGSEVEVLIALDRFGNEVGGRITIGGSPMGPKVRLIPFVDEKYEWTREDQIKNAVQYRDRIEYIFNPEMDQFDSRLAKWRVDDEARIKAMKALPLGPKVLEAGCSSGAVSIEIGKLRHVGEVIGIDIRRDAIELANDLRHRLHKDGHISQETVRKVRFECNAVEDFEWPLDYFDSVCAFEILEHLTDADLRKVLESLKGKMASDGSFFVSVPNRYPHPDLEHRSRWRAPDHKNYFSMYSLEMLLEEYFSEVKFYPVLDEYPVEEGVYLLAEAKGKSSRVPF